MAISMRFRAVGGPARACARAVKLLEAGKKTSWRVYRGGVKKNKPTGEVMNTTMDKDSFGTLLMDDPGDDDFTAGLWWTDVDYAMRSYVHDCGG